MTPMIVFWITFFGIIIFLAILVGLSALWSYLNNRYGYGEFIEEWQWVFWMLLTIAGISAFAAIVWSGVQPQ